LPAVADGGDRVALPEIRELLFADLPPLTAIETFAAVPDLHDLARAAAREHEGGARASLDRVLEGATESRIRLQAWSLARRVGIEPPPEEARHVRGVVVDVGFDAGTDTLAGFEDGTARYLNQGGGGIVWETQDATISAGIQALLAAGQAVAERSGPLDGPRPPVPPSGGASIWLLTDGGIHLGTGPFGALAADPLGGPVIGAATELMRLLIERSHSSSS
jgi:hypothetical protein